MLLKRNLENLGTQFFYVIICHYICKCGSLTSLPQSFIISGENSNWCSGHTELSALHGKHMQWLVLRELILQGGDCNHGEHHVSGSYYNNSVIPGSVGKKTTLSWILSVIFFSLFFFFFTMDLFCFVLFFLQWKLKTKKAHVKIKFSC